MTRLIIASNRLPVTMRTSGSTLTLSPSPGGLATGLRGVCGNRDALWIGWPGEPSDFDEGIRRQLERELAQHHLAPVHLSREEVAGYYEGIANGVLWPVFHDQINQISPELSGWEEFVSVNEKFSEAIATNYREGDLIWIQDFHLCLVPQMLRGRLPSATIGFFLHIPFPASEIFSVLPWREQILQGLLGADLIGFHTEEYLHNFSEALRRLLGLELQGDRILNGGCETILRDFLMGIDAAAWQARAEDPDTLGKVNELRRDAAGRNLLLGIDRLDYTKGILRRCLSVERLLAMDESLGDNLRYIQVTVPSRQGVEAYANLERKIDETIGRINAAYSNTNAVPIHRIHRSLPESELSVLYRAADVMLVTPLRDGMNLVAKEFVASRSDEEGVLVLSEFAGAAAEMKEALHVNPYDIEGTASVILRALTMPPGERRERMRSLRARVFEHDIHYWLNSFAEQLEDIRSRSGQRAITFAPPEDIALRLRNSDNLVLLLDYDGTLVPFADKPEDATPDSELRTLLRKLAVRPHTELHIVSGRTKDSLDFWLADLPLGLHAEHGIWSRPVAGEWEMAWDISADWMTVVRPILDRIAAAVPVTFVEEKTAGYAWHYRIAREREGTGQVGRIDEQARDVEELLRDFLANSPAEVVSADGVLEVRPRARNKGMIVADVLAKTSGAYLAAAIGDDAPDEDLFRALPDGNITVKVGDGPSLAHYRVQSVAEVRHILSTLVE